MAYYVYKYEWTYKNSPHQHYIYAISREQADEKFQRAFGKDLLKTTTVTRSNW